MIQRTAAIDLKTLNAVNLLDSLRVTPFNSLETLHFDRECLNSIRISEQWRICFLWQGYGARNVEIVDFHREVAP
jgi:toxin HigB-1